MQESRPHMLLFAAKQHGWGNLLSYIIRTREELNCFPVIIFLFILVQGVNTHSGFYRSVLDVSLRHLQWIGGRSDWMMEVSVDNE